jgi:hypothetical protein
LNKIRGASFQLGDVHKWNPHRTRCNYGKFIQRFAYRNPAKTNARAWLILSGILRSQQDELVRALQRNHFDVISMKASREMDGHSGRRKRLWQPPDIEPQIFAAVIDRRYSKNRCNLNSLLMPLSHPIRCGNRAPAASLAG